MMIPVSWHLRSKRRRIRSRTPAGGVASGVFSTSRYLGSIVGSSVLAGMLGQTRDGVAGFGAVFLLALIAAFLSAVASFGLHGRSVGEASTPGDGGAIPVAEAEG